MAGIIEEFISGSRDSIDVSDLVETFRISIGAVGFEHFALVRVRGHMPLMFDAPERFCPIAIHYPGEWVQHYEEHNLVRCDPVLRYARLTTVPYEWTAIPDRTAREEAVLRQAYAAGLRRCISLPIHEPFGHLFVGSVGTARSGIDVEGTRPLVHILISHLHARLSELDQDARAESGGVRLTPREQACLVWAARGKSSAATSLLIGTSESTVNFHMKNAMRKLRTKNRLSAVLKSLSLGLIVP